MQADKCVYFDGLSAQEHPCTVHVSDDCVFIYLTEQNNHCIICNKTIINDYQINGTHFTLKFGNYPHQVIECYGANATLLFTQLSKGNLTKTTKGFMSKHKLAVVLSVCILFVGACLAAYFIVLPWVGEKSATLISIETETQLGESISTSVLETNTVNDSASFYANRFLSQLKLNTTYPINITVLESDDINAFAVPGGKLFVYSGILKNMKSYEEFSALLGHEITHVTYQHSLKSICRSISSSLFIAAMFGDVSGITAGIAQQANEFKQLNYNRELETQADEKGLELMINNRISTKGMIDLLQMLDKESTELSTYMKYFSTHPETKDRIANIKSHSHSITVFEQNLELKKLFDKMKLFVK